MKSNKTCDYLTCCLEGNQKTTLGTVTINDMRACEPGEREELAAEEGFSWYCVHILFTFSDENAQSYGVSMGTCSEDYYDIRLPDATIENIEVNEGDFFDGCNTFTVNWNGIDYDQCMQFEHSEWSDWVDGVLTCDRTKYVRAQPVMMGGSRESITNWIRMKTGRGHIHI